MSKNLRISVLVDFEKLCLLDKARKLASKLLLFVPLQTGSSPSLTSPSLAWMTLCVSQYLRLWYTYVHLVLMRKYHVSLNAQTDFHRYEVGCRCLHCILSSESKVENNFFIKSRFVKLNFLRYVIDIIIF